MLHHNHVPIKSGPCFNQLPSNWNHAWLMCGFRARSQIAMFRCFIHVLTTIAKAPVSKFTSTQFGAMFWKRRTTNVHMTVRPHGNDHNRFLSATCW